MSVAVPVQTRRSSPELTTSGSTRTSASARRRFGERFEVGEATRLEVPTDQRYDFILVNSLFHHIDTSSTRRLLGHLPKILSAGGHVHIIELVLPPRRSLPRLLARADRGEFPRPLGEWHGLFVDCFDEVVSSRSTYASSGSRFGNWSILRGAPSTRGENQLAVDAESPTSGGG
jgi:hypothetical protein